MGIAKCDVLPSTCLCPGGFAPGNISPPCKLPLCRTVERWAAACRSAHWWEDNTLRPWAQFVAESDYPTGDGSEVRMWRWVARAAIHALRSAPDELWPAVEGGIGELCATHKNGTFGRPRWWCAAGHPDVTELDFSVPAGDEGNQVTVVEEARKGICGACGFKRPGGHYGHCNFRDGKFVPRLPPTACKQKPCVCMYGCQEAESATRDEAERRMFSAPVASRRLRFCPSCHAENTATKTLDGGWACGACGTTGYWVSK